MTCATCGNEISSYSGIAQEITGWEKPRKGGGTNHVLWREVTGRVMCSTCVIKKTHGVTEDQLTLA